ncbi:MAG TPA: SulP family inorganic anion transporter [Dissulfurispiraceae bacterium]|nr:SulP family inorganic anion transporter [Dissulfurispiraceae bacterium]
MRRLFPFISWLRSYRKQDVVPDLIAGITVAAVLIPQSMSNAMIAGLPPIYGLYGASIPPIVAALWGRSSQLATGPVAIVSLLTFASVLPFAKPGSQEFIIIAINLAAIVGTFQLIMGVLKLGFVMRFVSHPVIIGFTNAAAIIIATTQIKHLFGIQVRDSEFIFPIFVDIIKNAPHANLYTLGIGLFSLAIIFGGRIINKKLPVTMIALAVTTCISYLLGVDTYGVKTIGDMPSGMPSIIVPFWQYMGPMVPQDQMNIHGVVSAASNLEAIFRLIGPGIIIAIVGFMEAMAITKTIAEQTKQPVDIDQELIGQGAANVVGSFFHAYPVSGSFSSSAVNLQSGGRTALSNVFSGCIVIATLVFFTSAFHHLPKATLAAIVISAVVGLIKQSQFVKLLRTNKHDGIVALTTFFLAVITKPDYAIFIGIALSLLLFLWESMSPRIIMLTRDPRSEIFVNAEAKKLPICPQIIYLLPDFSIYFANAEFFRKSVLEKAEMFKEHLKYILLDLEMVNKIDSTGVDEMRELILDLRKQGVEIYLANVKTPVAHVLERSGLKDILEQDRWFVSKGDSITRLFNKIDYKHCRDNCPNLVFWECETVKYPYCKTEPVKICPAETSASDISAHRDDA